MEHTSESAAASVAALSLSAGASSEALVEALTEHAPVSVFITDAEGACVYANARACALTGLTAPESLGFGWTTALHPDDAERVTAEWTRAAASGANFEMEYRFLHTDGGVAWCEATASAVRDRYGALVGWVGVCVDVTARKASEGRYQELFENAHDVIYSADVSGNFLAVNKAAVDLLGFTRDELLTMNFFERIAPEEAEGTQEALVRALDGEEAKPVELQLVAKDGHRVHVEVAGRLVEESGQPIRFEGIARDMTDRDELRGQLVFQAFHDPLTALPNRALFLDRLSQALARAERRPGLGVAVMLLDLDNFKLINDSLGHHVGDQLLTGLADRLAGTMRGQDTVARLGGDEFGFVIESFRDERELIAVAERILAAFEEPFVTDSSIQRVTASIGIACGGREDDPHVLLRESDTAMYAVKSGRRGTFAVYDDKMQRRVHRALDVKNALSEAVAGNKLTLHYQPIVSLADGEVLSVEALVRWLHPQWGWVSPTEFIPLAEADELIVTLGRHVLTEAIRQTAQWHAQYQDAFPLGVSVNVSPRELADPDFIGFLTDTLHTHGLTPPQLGIEVTERVFIAERDDLIISNLTELAQLGVRLSLDDFGTGYSALASLKRFPFTTLKIDRYFTRSIRNPPSSTPITNAIVALGRSLNLVVIAEGVETQAQVNYLRHLGCHAAQGFHFARPQPAQELSTYLNENLSQIGMYKPDQAVA